MRRSGTKRALSIALLGPVLLALPAHAQSETDQCQVATLDAATRNRVSALKQAAHELNEAQQFIAAAREYRQAFEMTGQPALAFQAAQVLKFTDQLFESYRLFRYATTCGRDGPETDPRYLSAADSALARESMNQLRKKLDEVHECRLDSPDNETRQKVASLVEKASYRAAFERWKRPELAIQAGEAILRAEALGAPSGTSSGASLDRLLDAYLLFEYARNCGLDGEDADARELSRDAIARASEAMNEALAQLASQNSDAAMCQLDTPVRATRKRVAELAKDAYKRHRGLNFAGAADKYRQALALWKRPDLALQAGEAMRFAEQLIPAYRQFEYAKACGHSGADAGARGLSGKKRARAFKRMRQIRAKLAEIEVVCTQKGVKVRLDEDKSDHAGESWVACPGERREFILVGRHTLKVEKKGFVEKVWSSTLVGGDRISLRAELMSNSRAYRTRFKTWLPWVVGGVGGAVGLLGVGLQWRANSNFALHDQTLNDMCSNGPCLTEQQQEAGLPGLRTRAAWQQGFATGAFIAGGAALATGTVLLILNQKQSFAPGARTIDTNPITVTPTSTRSGVGVSVSGRF